MENILGDVIGDRYRVYWLPERALSYDQVFDRTGYHCSYQSYLIHIKMSRNCLSSLLFQKKSSITYVLAEKSGGKIIDINLLLGYFSKASSELTNVLR